MSVLCRILKVIAVCEEPSLKEYSNIAVCEYKEEYSNTTANLVEVIRS